MRTKKSSKKLSLKKQTISRLNGLQMQGVFGGYTFTQDCPRLSVEIACQTDTTRTETTNKPTIVESCYHICL